jgi:hypothetical protein
VRSWNIPRAPQTKNATECAFRQKAPPVAGGGKRSAAPRAMRASTGPAQVPQNLLNSGELKKIRHKILLSREPATSSDLPPLQTSSPGC